MKDYKLTVDDINTGARRVLVQAYATSTSSANPEIIFITGGAGSGKTSIEKFVRDEYRENNEKPFIVGADMIAEFHPKYEEILEEIPDANVRFKLTREFVRPATSQIFSGLFRNKICIINEKSLNKGQDDINLAKDAREEGYRIRIAIMATDLYESRLSCLERDARELMLGKNPRGASRENQLRMYNSFVTGIKGLQQEKLVDEIQVFRRGKTISNPPEIIYSLMNSASSQFPNFESALYHEREEQRQALFDNSELYFSRLNEVRKTFMKLSEGERLRIALDEIKMLEGEFRKELNERKQHNTITDEAR